MKPVLCECAVCKDNIYPAYVCSDCNHDLKSKDATACNSCGEEKALPNISTPAGPLSDDLLVNPKKAKGDVKAPLHTLPTLALIEMAGVMAGGALKYGFHNFRDSKIDAQTYIGAINRHFLKWQDGVDYDEESGYHELAHIMSCCAILIDAYYTDSIIDNRSKTGLVEHLLRESQVTFNNTVGESK